MGHRSRRIEHPPGCHACSVCPPDAVAARDAYLIRTGSIAAGRRRRMNLPIASLRSGQEGLDRSSLAQRDRPADGRDVLLGRVETDGLEHGGVKVGDVGGVDRVLDPLGVGRADDPAAPDAAAGERDAEAIGPVVAAVERVDLGRSAELARAEDDGPIELAALFQVADQGGEGRVEDRQRSCGGSRGC